MKRVWKNVIKNVNLSKKMTGVICIFASIVCLITIAALHLSFSIYDEKLYEKSLQELEFFTQQVNRGIEEVEELSYEITVSNNIQKQLSVMKEIEYPSDKYSYELQKLRSLLSNKLILYPVVKNIIYTNKETVITKIGTDTGELDDDKIADLIHKYEKDKGAYVSLDPTKDYPYLVSGRDLLQIENATLDYLGSVILTSDIEGIINKCNEALEGTHPTLYVYSQSGMIYQNGNEDIINKLPPVDDPEGYRVIRVDGEKYFMCYLHSSKNDWMYVNIFPYSEIFGQTMAVRYLTLLAIVLATAVMLFFVRWVVAVITRPLFLLAESMKTVEGQNFHKAQELIQDEERKDEIGVLTKEFRIMLDKIENLIFENYEKQILLQDTKYKMLQAQINPHFLYNTLNSLNWMIKADRGEEAGRIIVELGKLLRAAFAKNSYTTVADECDTARSYITIQQMRYKGRARMELEERGNLERWMIPRMILQPLIGNAVSYGVESSTELCEIKVLAEEREKDILLIVSDSGQGMTQEELKAVRDGNIQPKGHGIGLKNIRERLEISYSYFEFTVKSAVGAGTEIRIIIPKVEEGMTDV